MLRQVVVERAHRFSELGHRVAISDHLEHFEGSGRGGRQAREISADKQR